MGLQELFQYLFNEDEWRKNKVQQLPQGMDDTKPIPLMETMQHGKPMLMDHLNLSRSKGIQYDIEKLQKEIEGLQQGIRKPMPNYLYDMYHSDLLRRQVRDKSDSILNEMLKRGL